jgi:predicted 3-demethylubiquinone-9 3-methyltransferase (glyoxalase superfamily)
MIAPVFPCLWFDGKASEAANWYCQLFQHSEILVETPMVVSFGLNNTRIMALNGGPMFSINPSISLTVNCGSISETDRIWNALIEGGEAFFPIGPYPWSERYGWLQDKYGTTWQISSTGKNDGGLRILPSMLFTGGLFGKAEAAIQFYGQIFSSSSQNVLLHYPNDDENAGKVLYAEFTIAQSPIIAMDGPGEHGYTFNEAVSFVVECETQEEIDYYWEKLSEGGEKSQCGWLKDQFGVWWQVVPKVLASLMSDPQKAPLVFAVFMNMQKFDIETIIKAVNA